MNARRLARPAKWVIVLIVALLFLLIVFWAFFPSTAPDWTGFNTYVNEDRLLVTAEGTVVKSKTLWDWLDLLIGGLIVGAVLAIGGYYLNRSARRNELSIADSNRNQATLESYYDKMADLILIHKLKDENEGQEGRSIARARTLATLRALDVERKGSILRFLYESELIGFVDKDWKKDRHGHVISLLGADLGGASLPGSDLRGANLTGVYLSKANLRGANLLGADLRWAMLRKASLEQTFLSEADLRWANLGEANLNRADLSAANLAGISMSQANLGGANLLGCNLSGADLNSATLDGADLSGTDLSEAHLFGAHLFVANLSGADLGGAILSESDLNMANLSGADLVRADLSGADLRGADLREAKYDDYTKWPDGFDPEAAGAVLVETD